MGPSAASNTITFEIDNTPPPSVNDLRLNPADDTGVSGDDVTTDRLPYFIGTTTPGYTVELFINGQSAVYNTAVAGSTQMDANGQPYNFLIRLPSNLNNGETTVYVEVVDLAGNVSGPSNPVTVAITSTEVDYNGGLTSDPALFTRNTTTNELQWLVQTPPGVAGPWFGPGDTLYSSPSGTGSDVPFQGDFDGDGLTDLAYYNLSTATWTIDESSNFSAQGPVTLSMGTPNSSIPVVGYFSPNGGQLTQPPKVGQADELAVMTYSNGQDIWTIDSSTLGNYTVTMAGQAGDIPVPGDYDGVGYDQVAIYRPSTGQFIVLQQNYSSTTGTVTYSTETFNLASFLGNAGLGADLSQLVPVPDQYNNATPAPPSTTPIFGKTEPAVYDPAQGEYLIVLSPKFLLYGLRVPAGRHPGPGRLPGQRLGSGGRLPAQHRSVHRGIPVRAHDDPRHPRPDGRHPPDRPAVLSPAHQQFVERRNVEHRQHRRHRQHRQWRVVEHRQHRQRRVVEYRQYRQWRVVEHRQHRQRRVEHRQHHDNHGHDRDLEYRLRLWVLVFDNPTCPGIQLEARQEGGDEEGASEEAGQEGDGAQEEGDDSHRQEGARRSEGEAQGRDGRQDGSRDRHSHPRGRSGPGRRPRQSAPEQEAPDRLIGNR